MSTHKEITNHIRSRIKHAGIKARVKMNESCGSKYITVVVPDYETRFSSDEQRAIRHIAVCNNLTWVRKQPINVNQDTDPMQMDFYI